MAKRSGPRPKNDPGRRGRVPAESAPFRAALICLAALVTIVPLVVVPTARDSFTLPKLLASEWLALASIGGLALAASLRAASTTSPGLPAFRAPVVRTLAPLVVVASVSVIWSSRPPATREALVALWIGASALVAWSIFLGAGRLRRLLDLSLLPGLALGVLGILQVHRLFQPFVLDSFQMDRSQATSLAGNVGVLGGFLVLPLLLLLDRAFLVREASPAPPRWARPWALGAMAATLLYALFVSQTLTAFVALGTGGLVLALLRLGRPARRGVVAALIVSLLAVAFIGPLVSTRTAQKRDQLLGGDWNAALSYRGDGWRAAIDILERHPLLGTGHGTFKAEFAEARLRLVDAGHPVSSANFNPHFANAHNDYLEVGAELGLLGLAALAWALLQLALAVRRIDRDRPLAAAGCLSLGVMAFGYFPFETPLLAYPGIVFLAWVFARSSVDAAAEKAPE
jgi:O-antigen ligase